MTDFVFVEEKPEAGRQHTPEPGATIGREGCEVTIADPEISRRHAQLHRDGDALVIEDLGSTNGTFVNGERIVGRRQLADGDEVRFGDTVWRLQAAPGATRISQAPVADPQATRARAIPEPAPPAAEPEPPTEPQPERAPAASSGAPPATPVPVAERRGDVPPPDIQPSVIRRVVPPAGAPAPFDPGAPAAGRGSAATRLSATVAATVVVALTAFGVVLYYITEPFK